VARLPESCAPWGAWRCGPCNESRADEDKVAIARDAGADDVIVDSEGQFAGEVIRLSGGEGVHVARGVLKVRIGGTYPLAEASRAHADMESRTTTGKLLLIP
jgi:NADPH:quinone reductase-like Zn-dependent oxidoreductase